MESESKTAKLIKWLKETKSVTFSTSKFENLVLEQLSRDDFVLILTGQIQVWLSSGAVKIEGYPSNGLLNEQIEFLKSLTKDAFDFLWPGSDNSAISKERSFVSITFEIADSERSHNFDYHAFEDHIHALFEQYYPAEGQDNSTKPYIAPYFVFVQSSGMGKTKLLYDFVKAHQRLESGKDNTTQSRKKLLGCLILCRARQEENKDEENRIFNFFFKAKEIRDKLKSQKAGENPYNFAYKDILARLSQTKMGIVVW